MQRPSPPGHQWVKTNDDSFTLFSERFQESCHSTSGAREETLLHYVRGCEVESKLRHGQLTILEVGFGLGIGFLTTAEILAPIDRDWTFVSLELDRNLVDWFVREHQIQGDWDSGVFRGRYGAAQLIVVTGDARVSLPDYLRKRELRWNAIYQDAFSPKKNPTLWTREWFELLRSRAEASAILSTYSASSSIRKSLLEAGWVVTKGEKFGPKRSSTRARLTGDSDPEILEHLARSPIPALRDDNIENFLKQSKA